MPAFLTVPRSSFAWAGIFFAHFQPPMSQDRSSRRRLPASRRKTDARPDLPSRATAAAREPSQKTAAHRELITKRRGELAELAFALKAASLGFGVSRPWGDSERYDFILDADDLHSHPNVGTAALGCPAARTYRAAATPKPDEQHGRASNARQNGIPKRLKNTSNNKAVERRNHVAENKASERRKNAAHACPERSRRDASCGKGISDGRAPQGRKKPQASLPLPPIRSSRLWRVQVKASTQLLDGLYRVNSCRRINGRAVPYTAAEIDFFAAYIIPEDTWYILPIQIVAGRTSILLRRKKDRKPGTYDSYREAWPLLREK